MGRTQSFWSRIRGYSFETRRNVLNITVYLHTIYQQTSPKGTISQVETTLPPGSTILNLIESLGITLRDEDTLYVVNGKMADLNQVLEDGDLVHLIPAISGGYLLSFGKE
jgi:molybdopterin converting factor small subunit